MSTGSTDEILTVPRQIAYLASHVLWLKTGLDKSVAVEQHQPFGICGIRLVVHQVLDLQRVSQDNLYACCIRINNF